MIEIKFKAAEETIYVAKNQAADSGSYSVNALLWLLQEADTYDSFSLTDMITFTIIMFYREVIFYLHWYFKADHHHYMSFLKSYLSVTVKDIKACSNTVMNIINHKLEAWITAIDTALKALFSFWQHWKQACSSSMTSLTPTTLFTEETRLNKKTKDKDSKR